MILYALGQSNRFESSRYMDRSFAIGLLEMILSTKMMTQGSATELILKDEWFEMEGLHENDVAGLLLDLDQGPGSRYIDRI